MDYSNHRYSLWYWQWEEANQSVMPDGSIQTIRTLQDEHIVSPHKI
jgi:hypothetical protein